MRPVRRIFIGIAWPYANGSLHLGHASAFLGGDILARYHRAIGDEVLMVSGSDCFGTPIAVEASQQGVHPSEIAEKYHTEFQKSLIDGLGMSYDIYTKTTSLQHQKVVQEIFLKLYEGGYLYTKKQSALYSPYLKRFLPDRFVVGRCPQCKADDARGDQCDSCGSLLDPLDLIEPKINKKILTQKIKPSADELKLEQRESEHFYLKLSAIEKQLSEWVNTVSSEWRDNARTFAIGFIKQGLHDRAITRDTDWGVTIPLPGYEDKRIYVWFEAVLGYLSASKTWAAQSTDPESWEKFWCTADSIHYYAHGKDNIPFHTIILPSILLAEGSLHLPDRIVSAEYLTLENKQFSKSRGWAVWLPDFLAAFDADMLRYFITMYGPETGDSDFSWSDFGEKVNGELIGTFGNLVNRTLSFAEKHFPKGVRLAEEQDSDATALLKKVAGAYLTVGACIEAASFRAAFKEILEISQLANQYIHQKEVWHSIKDDSKKEDVENVLAVLSQCILNLGILVSPFIPKTSSNILKFFEHDANDISWRYRELAEYRASNVRHLFHKIEDEEITAQLLKLKSSH